MPTANAARLQRTTEARRLTLCAAAVLALVGAACSSKHETPEARVRAVIARAESAGENKDLAALRALLSESYSDSRGQDKRAIEALLRYHFLRHRSIYLFTRVQAPVFPRRDRAEVTVWVAMAGQPIAAAQELTQLRADLHRFDVILQREGDEWRVVQAEWRQAELQDFL